MSMYFFCLFFFLFGIILVDGLIPPQVRRALGSLSFFLFILQRYNGTRGMSRIKARNQTNREEIESCPVFGEYSR